MLEQHAWPEESETCVQRSSAQEQQIIERYAYLVKKAASHMRTQVGVVVDSDDVYQVGLMGLLAAARRYGKELDEQFPSYAFKRIRGAMLDEFRRTDWRPRQLRQQAHQFRDTERQLRRELGREPNDKELCQALGIQPEQLSEMQYLCQAEASESFEQALVGFADERDEQAKNDLSLTLKALLSRLPERSRMILQLYYSLDMNMKEIALALGLTEARVCQLHKQSLQALTHKLNNN